MAVSIDLADYFTDPENEKLTYSVDDNEYLDLYLKESQLQIISNDTGNYTVLVYVADIDNLIVSAFSVIVEPFELLNITNISIENATNITTNYTIINETVGMPVQQQAEIGKPVKWVRTIEDNLTEKLIELPKTAFNVSATEIRLLPEGIEGVAAMPEPINLTREANSTYFVNTTAPRVDLVYYTEPPQAFEEVIDKFKKEITVSSETHYTNILAYTDITESPIDAIKLYRTTNGTKVLVNITACTDTNDNSLIDRISWIVPELPNGRWQLDCPVQYKRCRQPDHPGIK